MGSTLTRLWGAPAKFRKISSVNSLPRANQDTVLNRRRAKVRPPSPNGSIKSRISLFKPRSVSSCLKINGPRTRKPRDRLKRNMGFDLVGLSFFYFFLLVANIQQLQQT